MARCPAVEQLIISALDAADDPVEVVERKGFGHPDTICDALAEALSRSLSREYQRRFGSILHHNVDKALLCAGRAAPAFRGGYLLSPINIYLGGRAISDIGAERIPIRDIAVETCRDWLNATLHALDAQQDVNIHSLIQPGSEELRRLFARGRDKVPLANDTWIGVGHAPLSPVERLVLAIEKQINGRDRRRDRPAWGEDIKIMAVRCGDRLQLTIACAMIGRYLENCDHYLHEKNALAALAQGIATRYGFQRCEVGVNVADDPATDQIYLTVTGTSAEGGDDGQVGRGNRVNGLITPFRPMSLEAAAGKNPVSHVGKLYNVIARTVAEAIIAELPQAARAQCLIVSRIGAPVTSPALVSIKVTLRDGRAVSPFDAQIRAITADCIGRIPGLIEDFVGGKIELF